MLGPGPTGWQAVRDEALRRIRSREWPAGARIPDEADLARELGCARTTVNRALRDLAGAGLLERRRRGGTRVPLTPVRKAIFSITIIRQDIAARAQVPGYRLLSDALAEVPQAVRRALGAEAPPAMRHILALHLADGAPYCLEDRWLAPEIAAGARFDTQSANEWLVQNVSFIAGSLSFQAIGAEPAQARALGCPTGAALLALERTTQGETGPITAVRLLYAPGHRVETDL